MTLDRKKLFVLHGWIGTKLSILFFIVCFSGTLATLSAEMDWLINPSMRAIPQEKFASRNTIAANFKKSFPTAEITHWSRNNVPYLCDVILKKENDKESYVFVNQYTGKIQGESNMILQRYFRMLHYNLFLPFKIGHFTVLLFGFLLFVSLATALLFYKKWWHKLFELKTGKGPLVFFRSLHRLAGLWSVPFTLLISITGFWYFIERTNIAGLGDAGNPEVPEIKSEVQKLDQIKLSLNVNYDKAIQLAEKQIPNLKVGDIAIPGYETDYLYLTGKSDVSLVRQRSNRVYIDARNYKIIKSQNAKDIGVMVWISDVADPLHFGFWGGLTTKIIWFLMGLSICSLILSGIWITLKRKAIQKKVKKESVLGIWKYINLGVNAVLLFFMYQTLIKTAASVEFITYISLFWIFCVAAGYYIFVYKIKRETSKVK
jgi:uncharacterized iron-regulated membrane protein